MGVAVAAGVALGVFSRIVDSVAPAWAGNSLALWLLVAFLAGVGVVAQDRRKGSALPAGAFAGEATFSWLVRHRLSHAVAALAAAIVLAVVKRWTRRGAWLAVAAASAVVAAAALRPLLLNGP